MDYFVRFGKILSLFWVVLIITASISYAEEELPWLKEENSNDMIIENPLGAAGSLPVKQGNIRGGFVPPSAEEIQKQIEADSKAQKNEMRQKAFDAALESLMPMTPEEIKKTLEVFRINREAAEQPVAVPMPKIQVANVSLEPDAEPLVIETSPGYVTTFVVVDIGGNPWPIRDVSWAGDFEIITPEEGENILRITPLTAHGRGNLSIRLVKLRTPIIFTLNTQLEEVHYKFEANIAEDGPLAEVPIIEESGLKTVADSTELVGYLDGRVPREAEKLMVSGTDGRTRAWLSGEQLIVRTPLTLLSPSWKNSVASGDGTRIYSLSETPVLLLSDRGKLVQVRLSTEEKSNE